MSRPITSLSATFAIQSYLTTGRMLAQTNGDPIVTSTKQYAQNPGVGFALHSSSQSPVAIVPKGGKGGSSAIVLVPGQKIIVGPFEEFEWGLPFGWLGGGTVMLYVLHSKDADVVFPSARAPVMFHRFQTTIVNGNTDANPTINFPLAFPWSNGIRVSDAGNSQPQRGAPLITIDPDVILLQLNSAAGVDPVTLTIQIKNCDPIDLRSAPDQLAGYTDTSHYFDFTVAPATNGTNPIVWIDPIVHRLGGDFAAFSILDPAEALGGETVDVIRYGRIG